MADNLDDFFAKKEKKKKGKTKAKKYTTTDELVKTFETEETEPSEKNQTQQEKTASERNKVPPTSRPRGTRELLVILCYVILLLYIGFGAVAEDRRLNCIRLWIIVPYVLVAFDGCTVHEHRCSGCGVHHSESCSLHWSL